MEIRDVVLGGPPRRHAGGERGYLVSTVELEQLAVLGLGAVFLGQCDARAQANAADPRDVGNQLAKRPAKATRQAGSDRDCDRRESKDGVVFSALPCVP